MNEHHEWPHPTTVQGRYPVPAEYGDRVRYQTAATTVRTASPEGEGTFTLAWLGIEETWDVRLDDGTTIHLHPCFGDTMEPAEPNLADCPYYLGIGICDRGCREEPACTTSEPEGGWPTIDRHPYEEALLTALRLNYQIAGWVGWGWFRPAHR